MTSTYRRMVRNKLGENPGLRYLRAFLDDNRMGNWACENRSTLSRNAVLLDRKNGEWFERAPNRDIQSWGPDSDTEGQAFIIDYLDSEVIQDLGSRFDLDPRLFQTHLAGCEQHYTGDWQPNYLTSAPCLRSSKRAACFVSFDYRRPYVMRRDASVATFKNNRIKKCSLLRSYHETKTAEALFAHERYSVAWFPGKKGQRPG